MTQGTAQPLIMKGEPVANPRRTRARKPVEVVAQPLETEIEYAVFNDPEKIAAAGIHPALAEKLSEPLFVSLVVGEAKRWAEHANTQRIMHNDYARMGKALLRARRVSRTPWETIEGAEYDEIDDGRTPYGR